MVVLKAEAESINGRICIYYYVQYYEVRCLLCMQSNLSSHDCKSHYMMCGSKQNILAINLLKYTIYLIYVSQLNNVLQLINQIIHSMH